MTEEKIRNANELFNNILIYKENLDTFSKKEIHQDERTRECFNIGKKIKDWFILRTEKGNAALKTNYYEGGQEFIGHLELDEEDMLYIQTYLESKYRRICKEFEELK